MAGLIYLMIYKVAFIPPIPPTECPKKAESY